MLCYTKNPHLLSALFTAIYTNATPSKFTARFLQELGFKSSKMRDLIPFLIAFGFLDVNGFPTSKYAAYKETGDTTLFVSACAKSLYSGVLSQATVISHTSLLQAFTKENPNADPHTLVLCVETFLALDAFAPFSAKESVNKQVAPNERFVQTQSKKGNFVVNINIPETENERIIEIIFKHLKELLRD